MNKGLNHRPHKHSERTKRKMSLVHRGMHVTHGLSNTRFYYIWVNMVRRCTSPKVDSYQFYGRKGIKVEWRTFEEFVDDMHESYLIHVARYGEKQTTIDRRDSKGNYSKQNCRWATPTEQARNMSSTKFIEFRGQRKSIAEWTEFLGFTRTIIGRRLRDGWNVEDALTIPTRCVSLLARLTEQEGLAER